MGADALPSTDRPALNRGPAVVGIVVALAGEARVLAPGIEPDGIHPLAENVRAIVCGAGPQRARDAARRLAASGVHALASFGTAGALASELGSGAWLLPQRILTEDGRFFSAAHDWRARLMQLLRRAADPRPLLSVSAPLFTREAKAEAARRTGACAVDMESAAIAAVAAECGLPFLCLRAVVDRADQTLPRAAIEGVDMYGRARCLALAAALLSRPGELPALWRLGRGFARARRALALALERVGRDLAFPAPGEPAAAPRATAP